MPTAQSERWKVLHVSGLLFEARGSPFSGNDVSESDLLLKYANDSAGRRPAAEKDAKPRFVAAKMKRTWLLGEPVRNPVSKTTPSFAGYVQRPGRADEAARSRLQKENHCGHQPQQSEQ